jgi:hypothetical protein
MHIMDETGDTTVTWDPADLATIEYAESQFREAKARGYRADSLDGKGGGEVIHDFDQTATEIVMSPQLVGG